MSEFQISVDQVTLLYYATEALVASYGRDYSLTMLYTSLKVHKKLVFSPD